MLILVAAMVEEAVNLIEKLNLKPNGYYWEGKDCRLFITGIGRKNARRVLNEAEADGLLTKNDYILNFGFAGGNKIQVGQIISVRTSRLYEHPKTNGFVLKTPVGFYESGAVDCYTSDEFVEKTEIKSPCLFDMELFEICRHAHRCISSIKVVSDNLSEGDFDKNIKSTVIIPYGVLINRIEKIIENYQKEVSCKLTIC